MKQLETIVGNKGFVQAISTAMQSNRLAHSLLICGEDGTGTDYAARCIAADWLYKNDHIGSNQVMNGGSGEYTRIDGEGASGNIKIERIRDMRKSVFKTALSAEGRVVHISDAQNLEVPSANALLKILEEPPENVLFILTAPSEAAVLPTIRSRCCTYSLAPCGESECAEYLVKTFDVKKDTAQHLAEIFGGKIGYCAKVLNDADVGKLFDDAEKLFSFTAVGKEYDAGVLLATYEKNKDGLKKMLPLYVQVCAAALKRGQNARAAVCGINAARDAMVQLNANLNQKLVGTVLAAHASSEGI